MEADHPPSPVYSRETNLWLLCLENFHGSTLSLTPNLRAWGSAATPSPDEMKERIAHWAGRVWCHSNEVPSGNALGSFDLMSLKKPFLQYVKKYGEGIFDQGLTLEEIRRLQTKTIGYDLLTTALLPNTAKLLELATRTTILIHSSIPREGQSWSRAAMAPHRQPARVRRAVLKLLRRWVRRQASLQRADW